MDAGTMTVQAESGTSAAAQSPFTAVACRTLDLLVAVVLLVLLVPLFAVVAIAIRLDSPGRVIFRQKRVGLRRRPFTVNKFRTMHSHAGHEAHRTFVLRLITANGSDENSEK